MTPETTIDDAASLMREQRVGGLPVVANQQVVGMITETDIFTAFLEMLGVPRGGMRITLELVDRHGALADIAELFRDYGVNIVSGAAFTSDKEKAVGQAVFRIEDCEDPHALVTFLQEKGYKVIHYS